MLINSFSISWIKFIASCIFLISSFSSFGQTPLDYFLPDNVTYSDKIPTPAQIIGHEVGEWHISHDKLVTYMRAVAQASDRVKIETFGYTYEKRPLVLLTISSKENMDRIEELKKQHYKLTDPEQSASLNLNDMPAVAYMGMSIHGNEPSGSNASLALAYYLAAAQGEEIEVALDNVIILLDPSFNPDGLDRFASWVNTKRSLTEVADPQNIEQNEPWPGGRTNHYWFDMNRDWLPAQLPESQARLVKFHEWKPNVLTDHHEMGTNSTFFFQPGIPSRNNPLTPENTYKLTDKMGEYHAEALDAIGSLYYTKESFDDYYYGKGSTYPDIQGAVGILFEQASSRGHAQESINGILRFPFTILNQFTTALSTLKAVSDMRVDFLEHQRDFYRNAAQEAQRDRENAYVFGDTKDPARAYHLAELINRHDIEVYNLNQSVAAGGKTFSSKGSYVVPLNQRQYRLIKAMFETRTSFQDSLFYDVSTWTLPAAFNLPYGAIGSAFNKNLLGEKFESGMPKGEFIKADKPYAYIFEWNGYYAPKALYTLQKEGLRAKVATEVFTNQGRRFSRGSIVIPAVGQELSNEEIDELMKKISGETGINIFTVSGGLDYNTFSLGSPTFDALEQPKIAMLIGDGISSYEAGEVWHLFDQRYEIPVSKLDVNDFGRFDLSRYNTIIMVSGSYASLSNGAKEKLKNWIQNGGTVVAQRNALQWLSSQNLGDITFRKTENEDSLEQRRYSDISNWRGAQATGGAIFRATGDLTHPLLYGYSDPEIYMFRNHNIYLEPGKNPFANPITYGSQPLVSGYISEENLEKLQNTSAAGIINVGRGKIVAFTDNPNFRAFWYGTNKMFTNAIFFAPVISRSAGR